MTRPWVVAGRRHSKRMSPSPGGGRVTRSLIVGTSNDQIPWKLKIHMKGTCAVCVGDNRRSWLGSVCPCPQDLGGDPLPFLSESDHPELILGGRAQVGHCSSGSEKISSGFLQNSHLVTLAPMRVIGETGSQRPRDCGWRNRY